jgi:Hg(II)-responsive transcriptional regulator
MRPVDNIVYKRRSIVYSLHRSLKAAAMNSRRLNPASGLLRGGGALTLDHTSGFRIRFQRVMTVRIGELASQTNVAIETLRYYEKRGLLQEPDRSPAGYRAYSPDTVRRVRFIRRAQELGFTLQEIADLLTFWEDSATSCGRVEARATATLGRIDQKIRDLEHMRSALAQYVTACRTREALSECPLLASLAWAQESTR